MAKANVHTSSREELIEAGVRAEHAEEILKLRRKGKVEIEALDALPGVGPATLEQLRKSRDFSDKAQDRSNGAERAKEASEKAADVASSAARSDAETARSTAQTSVRIASTAAKEGERSVQETTDKAADAARATLQSGAEAARSAAETGARVASIAARSGLETVRRTVDAAAEVERETFSLAAEGTSQLSQMLVDLVNEQTRHNAEVLTALSQAVDWERVFRVQSELMQANLERTAEFTRRYFEVTQAVMTSALSAADRQARKAA